MTEMSSEGGAVYVFKRSDEVFAAGVSPSTVSAPSASQFCRRERE